MARTKKQAVSAHDLDRIIVRLPPGMREKLGERAVENGRSVTAEVVAALTEHLRRKDRLSALEAQVEALQDRMSRFTTTFLGMLAGEKNENPPE